MSGTGPPAHRAPASAQRNRIIAVGAGLLLALILLFALLAYCTDIGEDGPPTAGPGTSSPYPTGAGSPTTSPGGGGPGTDPSNGGPGTGPSDGSPGNGGPGTGSPGVSPSNDNPGTGPGNGSPGTEGTEGTTDEPAVEPDRSPTPSGGVDAGGGGLIPGRRTALLVTGIFLLLAAAAAGAYALRRPLHHR